MLIMALPDVFTLTNILMKTKAKKRKRTYNIKPWNDDEDN